MITSDFENNQTEFTKKEKLQLLSKIEDVKYEISESEIEKSGKNTFQKYNYFELKDFMPFVRKITKKYNIATQFNVIGDEAFLNVFDLDTGCFRRWRHNLPEVPDTQINKQGKEVPILPTEKEKIKGALETYARRYLYLAFLELTDGDPIDSGDVNPHPQKSTKKSTKKKYATPKEVAKQVHEELGDKYSIEEAEKLLQQWIKDDWTTMGIKKLTLDLLRNEEE